MAPLTVPSLPWCSQESVPQTPGLGNSSNSTTSPEPHNVPRPPALRPDEKHKILCGRKHFRDTLQMG